MDYAEILYEKRDDAAWIGINRPEVRNAFREQTLDELAHALESTREDPTIVAAVVYGVGGHFSAGGDFHAMMKLNKANSYMWNDRMLKVAMTCRNLPIPVIAMVEGACVGGGHELMLWCDLVITADDATFGQTGARVGACPTVGATQYIAKLIGERRAKEMIFLCKRYTGAEAAEIGLANEALPAGESASTGRGDRPADEGLLVADPPGYQGVAELRFRRSLPVMAARHGVVGQHLGHGGEPGGHERFPGEATCRLPSVPCPEQERPDSIPRRLR